MKKLLALVGALAITWYSVAPANAQLSGTAADLRVGGAGVSATNPVPITVPTTLPVSLATTAPVAIASSVPLNLNAGTNTIGSTGSTTTPDITQLSDGTTPTQKAAVSAAGAVKVDNSAVTQPVSGSVGLSAGTNLIGNVNAYTGGAAVTAANPLNVQQSISGAAIANNNPLIVGSQNTADVTGTISSATQSSQINLFGSACVQVTVTGSFTATINIQSAADASASASFSNIKDAGGGSAYTAAFTRQACSPGNGAIRLNVTPYTSGTINYTLHLIPATTTNVGITAAGGNSASIGGYTSNYTTSNFGLNTIALDTAYNGTSFDAIRKDTYTAGPLWMTAGGSATSAIAAATAGPTVIKASAGRLARVLVTAGGATTPETFYDNASACSGTVIGIVPTTATDSTAVSGRTYSFDLVATSGITACGGAGSPAVTVGYF